MLPERQRKLIAKLTIFFATTVFEALCNMGRLNFINSGNCVQSSLASIVVWTNLRGP